MTTTAPRHAKYKNKAASTLQKDLAQWLKDNVGINPDTDFKTKDEAFNRGVALTKMLGGATFSQSPEQANRREERERKSIEKARAVLEKFGMLPSNGSVVEDEDVEDEDVEYDAEEEAEDDADEEEAPAPKPAPPARTGKRRRI